MHSIWHRLVCGRTLEIPGHPVEPFRQEQDTLGRQQELFYADTC